jgi:hypothetical protein
MHDMGVRAARIALSVALVIVASVTLLVPHVALAASKSSSAGMQFVSDTSEYPI